MDSAFHILCSIYVVLFAGFCQCSYANILRDTDELSGILLDAMMNKTWLDSMLEEQRRYEAETWYSEKLWDVKLTRAYFADLLQKLGAFPCPALSPSGSVPTSVHELRPSDIKIVGAIGDSYTAARAAGGLCPFNMLFDYRGNAWSIGGDNDYDYHTSMPNILREYRSDLYGFSSGVGDCQRKFNVAETGARSDDFANQAASLVSKLQSDSSVDFENDWKLITVFLGGNDLCEYCKYGITPAVYTSNVRAGLDVLYNNIPRAFVNLVVVMHVGLTQELREGLISCLVLRYACACGTFPESEADNTQLAEYSEAYQQALLDIAASGDYDSDNFTVVAQPFFLNLTLPYKADSGDLDYSFFAIDRFHISKKGQAVAGRGLWNNMFEPVGNKSTDVVWYETDIICPTEESPYLFTSQNSDVADYMPYRQSFEYMF
ncbi:hypothetical protein EGW08_008587 [Elysia chlorotica]|uniref:Phospholipase B1, membrane-associated n=1 Tax=Elysia chlorotica TaxID=188477 RepID=A0A3S1BAC9_ELYCH|nr:hypothetical protein EGW08_008587 [Elysia chlorotica]